MNFNKSKSYNIKDYRKKSINLLPKEFHKVNIAKLYFTIVIFLSVVAAGLFAFYEYNIVNDTAELERSILDMETAMASKTQKIENQKLIIDLGSRIEMKEILLNFIFSTNRSIVEILDTFEASMNGEIYLASLSANSINSFTISASSTSNEAISHLINQLKLLRTTDGGKYFRSVFANGITRSEDESGNVLYLFQLNCEFEGGVVSENQ